jgi:uncharacterized protein (DUF1330 family)
MAVYAIVDIDVTDPDAYEGYKKGAAESIAAHGGRYLARGGRTTVVEGTWTPKRLVIVEFPTMAKFREWYEGERYRAALAIRTRAAVSNFVVVEGL